MFLPYGGNNILKKRKANLRQGTNSTNSSEPANSTAASITDQRHVGDSHTPEPNTDSGLDLTQGAQQTETDTEV